MKQNVRVILLSIFPLVAFVLTAMAEPPVFIQNIGQWQDNSIKFALDSSGVNVGLTNCGMRFQIFSQDKYSTYIPADLSQQPDPTFPQETVSSEMHDFSLVFEGAESVTPVGRNKSESKFNYFIGNTERYREEISSFNSVWYENLYPGVSLELIGRNTGLKYNFHIAPGADHSAIRVAYHDVEQVKVTEDGRLQIDIIEGRQTFYESNPYVYQIINNEEVPIAARYLLLDNQCYKFDVTGSYDPALPLVIDPEIIWDKTISGAKWFRDITIDHDGNIVAAGYTNSSNWVSGGWDTTYGGDYDGFVIKLTASGEHIWSTYIGGDEYDDAYDVATDSTGNVLVASYIGEANRPKIFKLNADGQYVWDWYRSQVEQIGGVAVDSQGNVLVAGFSDGRNWVSGGWNTTDEYDSFSAGFSAKLSPTGTHIWSTYFGWLDNPHHIDYQDTPAFNVVVDINDNVYVSGRDNVGYETYAWVSKGWNTNVPKHSADGYIVKMGPSGNHIWSSWVGGSNVDGISDITTDIYKNVYITGSTKSSSWLSGGWDTTYNGNGDGYIVKLGSSGQHIWSSYLGGTEYDDGLNVAVDNNNVFIRGRTWSTNWVLGGWITDYNEDFKGFVVDLNSAGQHVWSSYCYLSYGLALDGKGAFYLPRYSGLQKFVYEDNEGPQIEACVPSQYIEVDASCQAIIPDFIELISAYDNYTPREELLIAQNPESGTLVSPGEYPLTFTVTDSYGNTATCETQISVFDDMPPVFVSCSPTIEPYCLEEGASVKLPDLTEELEVIDNCITPMITQDPTAGTHISTDTMVTVTATDDAGNISTCEITVIVFPEGCCPDLDPPIISLLGEEEIIIECGSSYIDPGVTVYDYCGGDLTNSVVTDIPVNTMISGTYTIHYNVYDAAGNIAAEVKRTVQVLNNCPTLGEEHTFMLPGDVPLTLVRIPVTSFLMGAPETERGSSPTQRPVHVVTIGNDFFIGKYEVTQEQWLALMGSWPEASPTEEYGLGDFFPAYYISWYDAKNFIDALHSHLAESGQANIEFRLPTEAEWEYACRAGTQTRFFFGDSLEVADNCEHDDLRTQYIWYCANTTSTRPVGEKLPNTFGLYDMLGNVAEWCEDDWHGNYVGAPIDGTAWIDTPRQLHRVKKGGRWNNYAYQVRSAGRGDDHPGHRGSRFISFRLAADLYDYEEGENELPHPGDLDVDWKLVLSEAIAYLAGWQQGSNPISYAIRAAYLWQNGEQYMYDAEQAPPLCWVLAP